MIGWDCCLVCLWGTFSGGEESRLLISFEDPGLPHRHSSLAYALFPIALTAAGIMGAILGTTPAVQGSPWQVVARFDPARPITVRVLNRTPHPLEYGLSDPYPTTLTEVQTGQKIQLEQVVVPNCLALNTPMLSPVQYAVASTQDAAGANLITVEVTTVNDVSGDHCLDLQESGAIFIY